MQEVCRYAVVHCFTFFHLTWLPSLAFILDIAARYFLFMLTLYISFLTVVTSVLYHLSIALSLTSLILLNLNLPLLLFILFSPHPFLPLLSSSFPPSSLLILSSLFSPHPFIPLLLPLFPSSSTILSIFSLHPIPLLSSSNLSVFLSYHPFRLLPPFHQTVSIRR